MASTEAPIGASVIDYIKRNSVSSVDDSNRQAQPLENDDSVQSTQSIPTAAPPSLIACHKSCNVLLKGVQQSGQGSIAMNMGHSIASSCPCQGACGGSTCTCVAVSILTPLLSNNNDNNTQESFPMSCQFVESSPLDFYGQLRALQESGNKTITQDWNKAALRRIQVHRMANTRDVLEFLLSIQGNGGLSCPTGGIILQDLDVLVRGNSSNEELSTEQLMAMTQILALLADTANTVRRSLPASCPFSVLVTMTTSVPWNVHRLWCTWFSTVLNIQPQNAHSNTSWKAPLLDDDESVESQFVLNKVEQDGTTGKEQPTEMIAHYAIVRQNNGCFRIVWKRESE